jgi:arsenate reductase
MAEGWARALLADRVEPCSAGTDPRPVDPLAVRAMAEAGVDISRQPSRRVDAFLGSTIDLVVTVCDAARETCPQLPGAARSIHAGFDDPPRLARGARNDDEALAHYRRVRDEIRRFIETLPESMKGARP